MPWEALEAIARDVTAGEADAAARAERLLPALSQVPIGQRDEALAAVASALLLGDPSGRLLRHLASSGQRPARQLALELAARWPGLIDRTLLPVLRPLLLDRSLPVGAQLATVIVLLQAVGKSGAPAISVVRSFVTGLDKSQVRERLDALEQRIGNAPALEEMRARLDAKLSMRCPRCDKKFERADLANHVWRLHRLVLDGALVREPWSLVEDWLADAAVRADADRLARCFELVQFVDPERGLIRFERLLADYALAGEPPPAGRRVCRCPRCTTEVACRAEVSVPEVTVSHGRLSQGGYVVELSMAGLSPHLQVETPEAVVYEGREPGHWLTPRGACFLLAAPPVLAAWVVLVVLTSLERPATWPVTLLLAAGLLILAVIQAYYRLEESVQERALDHAWDTLAPMLHSSDFSSTDSAFLAGLAACSVGRGKPARRERALEQAIGATEKALGGRPEFVQHLASLWRLAAEDCARLGRDPVPLVARHLNRCLDGHLPLAAADRFLRGWHEGALSPAALARLRLLVCQRAFDNGAVVADLIEAGRLAPALGELLGKPETLAHLGLLFAQRTSLSWEECGEAFTVFELAGPGGMPAAHLEDYPDLLLYQFLPGQEAGRGPAAILVTSRGVAFGDTLFTKKPGRIELKQAPDGYQLSIGASRFTFREHPGDLGTRLERWFHFFFDEFLPKAPAVLAASPTGLVRKLRFPEAVSCPKCRQKFLPQPGDVGIALN